MSNDERQAFEAWLGAHDNRGFNPAAYTEHACKWNAWQAARAAPTAQEPVACTSEVQIRSLKCGGGAYMWKPELATAHCCVNLYAAPPSPINLTDEQIQAIDRAADALDDLGATKNAAELNAIIAQARGQS